ncbi:hypothetical protein ACQW02_03240 [Humitalea sp. 24SJ18S-53]|uniref:hypothetical protein n=1 Tax=Humitalea sp. 24SJ18S-53 TaxID=3422307 RepID=UPI003D6757E2
MSDAILDGLSLGPQPQFLPPDIQAQYEAAFGVLVVNGDSAAFTGGATRELIEAINHETYHHLQTVCSGYGLTRAEAIRRAVIDRVNAAAWRDLRDNPVWLAVRTLLGWAPGFLRRRVDIGRLERVVDVALTNNRAIARASRDTGGDPSLAAAVLPGLFAALDGIRAEMWLPREGGLADGHVVEGAAVAFTAAVTAASLEGPEVLLDGARLEAHFVAANALLDADYSALLTAAQTRFDGPVAPWLLPATALAMRYEHPGAAVLPLLDRLRAEPAADALAAAQALAEELTGLPGAGDWLGTARDVHLRGETGGEVHDAALAALDETGLDEVTVLADPMGFGALPAPLLSSVIRFNDRVGAIGLNAAEAAVRVAMANLALRAQTRRRFDREANDAMARWAQGVLHRLVARA